MEPKRVLPSTKKGSTNGSPMETANKPFQILDSVGVIRQMGPERVQPMHLIHINIYNIKRLRTIATLSTINIINYMNTHNNTINYMNTHNNNIIYIKIS